MLRALADVEEEHVRRVLDAVEGNKAKAARVLGVSKPKLYRMLDRYGIGESAAPGPTEDEG